jgi:predicted DNA-binding transcriptional regulator YafY
LRRADRLFRIIQTLRRRRRVVTAAALADGLGVSRRTIYRDVSDLLDSGVPITGEAGVGYALSRSYDLPPLMFEDDEIQALVFGARLVRSWADPELAAAAANLLDKVESVLPERLQGRVADTMLFSFADRFPREQRDHLGRLRRAIGERRMLTFGYRDEHGAESRRTVRPLGLLYWGAIWTLAAWCELRDDFRNFRVDRMQDLEVGATFEHRAGQTLEELFRRYDEGTAETAQPEPRERLPAKRGAQDVRGTQDRNEAGRALQRRRVGEGGR